MPTYEELLAQNNYLKNHVKYQAAKIAGLEKQTAAEIAGKDK